MQTTTILALVEVGLRLAEKAEKAYSAGDRSIDIDDYVEYKDKTQVEDNYTERRRAEGIPD